MEERQENIKAPIIPRLKISRVIFYLVTIAALVLLYFKFSELRELRNVFLISNQFWVGAILLSQLLTYFFLANNYREVLRMKGLVLDTVELIPVTFIIQFITQALPTGGLSGEVFFIYYLRQFKLSYAQSFARALLEVLTLYTAYSVTFVITFFLMLSSHMLQDHPIFWLFVYAFVFFAGLAFFAFLAIQKNYRVWWVVWIIDMVRHVLEGAVFSRIKKFKLVSDHAHHVSSILSELQETLDIHFLKKESKLFWQACLWQFLLLTADSVTIYFIALALNHPISLASAFIVFTLTKLITITSFVPGALGIFEVGMTAILHVIGMTTAEAVAVTLLFRGITFWLPMPIGWLLYGHYVRVLEAKYATMNGDSEAKS